MHHRGGGVGHTTQAAVDKHFMMSVNSSGGGAEDINAEINDPNENELTLEEINELAETRLGLSEDFDSSDSEMDFDEDGEEEEEEHEDTTFGSL